MERFDGVNKCEEEFPKVDEFIEAVLDVCKKYGYSIAHEDVHGAFEIHIGYDEDYAGWLRKAIFYPPKK